MLKNNGLSAVESLFGYTLLKNNGLSAVDSLFGYRLLGKCGLSAVGFHIPIIPDISVGSVGRKPRNLGVPYSMSYLPSKRANDAKHTYNKT